VTELLTDQLRLMARRHPDEIGYRNLDAGTAITFARWDEESNRLARGLAGSGVAKGDRVSIYLPSEEVLHWVVAYAAVHKAGAVAVPTNTRLTAAETSTILGHAEASAAITCSSYLATLAAARQNVPTLGLVVSTDGNADAELAPSGAVRWDSVAADDATDFQVDLDPGDLADIMYTSGTTGSPKGVVVRHRNASLLPNNEPHWTGTAWLHGSPLFTFAGISFVYNPMKLGKSAFFLPKFDAGRWLEVVAAERPEAAFIVPAMAQLILAHPQFETADLSSLQLCSLGSAPVSASVLRRLQERMPDATISNGYGMTEAGPAFCAMPKDEAWRRAGSVGKPMPPMEVRIVAPAGGDLPAGDVGEVLIRLPGRQREYYRDPDATARTWTDGWLHTGDLGRLDEDGYLYIVGRTKEVIIRGGNNIYATDVENALLEHAAVIEAAVVAVPHEVLGEDLAAFVVTAPGQVLDVEQLRAFLSERLADYKVPRRVTFVDHLPRNATGKVLKHELHPGPWAPSTR
jgi:acyl-CoA synthetase (AMP-forming)/AMP-acid ligase II